MMKTNSCVRELILTNTGIKQSVLVLVVVTVVVIVVVTISLAAKVFAVYVAWWHMVEMLDLQ